MTVEQEARDLLNAVSQERFGYESFDMADSRINHRSLEAVCRALEQRNAANADAAEQALADFRREVSDEIKRMFIPPAELRRFILPDPVNPRVAALRGWVDLENFDDLSEGALFRSFARLEAVLAEHGGKIAEIKTLREQVASLSARTYPMSNPVMPSAQELGMTVEDFHTTPWTCNFHDIPAKGITDADTDWITTRGPVEWPLGTLVEKVSGPHWRSKVVGYYSSSFTLEGLVLECTAVGALGQVHVEPAKRMVRNAD